MTYDNDNINILLEYELYKNTFEPYVKPLLIRKMDEDNINSNQYDIIENIIFMDMSKDREKYQGLINFYRTYHNILYAQTIGDIIGYRDGKWEFNYDFGRGMSINDEQVINKMIYDYFYLGGINHMDISRWNISDDTVLFQETFYSLVMNGGIESSISNLALNTQRAYKENEELINSRHPGDSTRKALKEYTDTLIDLPYNDQVRGNGAVIRSNAIGMLLPGLLNRKKLYKVCISNSRLTHNSSVSFLGCITIALFMAFALEGLDIKLWPYELLQIMSNNDIDDEIKRWDIDFKAYMREKLKYKETWNKYLDMRFSDGIPKYSEIRFINPIERHRTLRGIFLTPCNFYGGCADDVCIIAYDSLVFSKNNLELLLYYSVFHTGDSDSIASISFSLFAAYYPTSNDMNTLINKFRTKIEHNKRIDEIIHNPRTKDMMSMIFMKDIYYTKFERYINIYNK